MGVLQVREIFHGTLDRQKTNGRKIKVGKTLDLLMKTLEIFTFFRCQASNESEIDKKENFRKPWSTNVLIQANLQRKKIGSD